MDRLGNLYQPVTHEALDRLIQAGPGPHVDDAVLSLGLDQLLHPIDVHRLLEQDPENDQAQRRASGCLWSSYGHEHTRKNIPSQDAIKADRAIVRLTAWLGPTR